MRASLTYLVNAVMLFFCSAGIALVLFLKFGHIQLSSSDPFFAALGPLWVAAGVSVIIPALVMGVLWRRAHRLAGHQWTRADLRLGVLLVALGLVCGQAAFSLQYAQAQSQVNATLTAQFLDALKQTGLQLKPDSPESLAFDDRGRVMWAAGPGQCPQARVQWERLDARWEPQKSGGMMTAGMLETVLLRTLWFHGCLTDADYLAARHTLTLRAERATSRLQYEKALPVWGLHWPVQSWARARRPLLDRIELDQKAWCEDKDARAGWATLAITDHCAKMPHPTQEVPLPMSSSTSQGVPS